MSDITIKIKKLKEKRNAYDEKIKQLEILEKEKERRIDARKKIIAGAVLLKYFEKTNQQDLLKNILKEGIDNEKDLGLFNIHPQSKERK